MDIVNGELKNDMKHCSLGNGTTVFVIMAPSFQAGQGLEPWIQKDIQQHESLRWKKRWETRGPPRERWITNGLQVPGALYFFVADTSKICSVPKA